MLATKYTENGHLCMYLLFIYLFIYLYLLHRVSFLFIYLYLLHRVSLHGSFTARIKIQNKICKFDQKKKKLKKGNNYLSANMLYEWQRGSYERWRSDFN